MSDGVALAIAGGLCLMFGGFALVKGLSLDSAARDFTSASQCRPGIQYKDCLEQRAIEISAVGTGRYGEVTTVVFLDNGNRHESHLGLGLQDRSVLHPGASGTTMFWQGKYTNLDVAGTDFATDENPVGQQRLWMLFALIGISFALIIWVAALVWDLMNRRAANLR